MTVKDFEILWMIAEEAELDTADVVYGALTEVGSMASGFVNWDKYWESGEFEMDKRKLKGRVQEFLDAMLDDM